ncbi:MAG TPA: LLM class flavin-dependent oxidoreductase, partial [Verrucomicrobiae bacterium]|nr:LLM class flavin-dependent oxidoreductase [Verrucomicrobiae bacterium]
MKPFRFGINARDARSRAEWQDKARKIEAPGYSVLLVPDHFAAMLATIPAVVSAADATTSLRIGTNVLNNDLRHPVLLAREA